MLNYYCGQRFVSFDRSTLEDAEINHTHARIGA
jgi:hypothetical protein